MARMDRHRKQQELETVYRAAFPPEDEEPDEYIPRHAAKQEEEPFTDEEEPRVYLPPIYRVDRQEVPAAFSDNGYDGAAKWKSPPYQRHGSAFWSAVAFLCVGLLALMGYWVYSRYTAYAPFRKMVAATEKQTFAPGVLVDDVEIGGLTREEAEQRLRMNAAQQENDLHITLSVDGQIWYLTQIELPFTRNLGEVLDMAYAVGRQGSRETIISSVTPIEYRYAHLTHTAENPVRLYTAVTYDRDRVRELTGSIKAQVDREPQDAMVSAFDFTTRSFSFTDDVQGASLDADMLAEAVMAALDRGEYQAKLMMESEKILPRVTKSALMSSFTMISTYSTETTSSANRNTNIDLAARAVMGTVVMPGETFSFNQTTGQRTTEKGYLPAAAIAGGSTVDEVGGGVCQVSSTLFNAAAMADLTILTRYPHTWPSTYVDKGRDATVNWPNLDFVFRNDRQTPIFIVSYYQNRRVTVELYGAALEPGVTIELMTQTVSETPPPEEAIYEMNPQLPPGTVQEKKKARTGYEVETYKVYKKNGVEIKREWLCDSSYKMIQQVIEYN